MDSAPDKVTTHKSKQLHKTQNLTLVYRLSYSSTFGVS